MRAHKDPSALRYSFYEIISANDSSPILLRELRDRCLNPGMYAQHIERWLTYFPQRQVSELDITLSICMQLSIILYFSLQFQ